MNRWYYAKLVKCIQDAGGNYAVGAQQLSGVQHRICNHHTFGTRRNKGSETLIYHHKCEKREFSLPEALDAIVTLTYVALKQRTMLYYYHYLHWSHSKIFLCGVWRWWKRRSDRGKKMMLQKDWWSCWGCSCRYYSTAWCGTWRGAS